MEKNTVTGKVLINNKWQEKEVEIPPFIDIAPYCFKKNTRKRMEYLKRNTFLSDDRTNVLTKLSFQEKLRQDPQYAHLVIPTKVINSFADITEYTDTYSKSVLKPSGGIQGKGIYILQKSKGQYRVGYKTAEKKFDETEMERFYEDHIAEKGYIIQKYISSKTPQGDPFDCRIHVEKNGDGEWQSARNYIRIGIGQKVISNVNQGGGIADVRQFLKANYGDRWNEINNQLKKLAVTLPYKVEELRGTHIMSLGFDIGITEEGEMYVFEVNDGPATKAVIAEVSYLRANYYKFILDNLPETKDKYSKVPAKEYDEYDNLIEERNYYKKKYNQIQKSHSWKITSPLRNISDLIKGKRKNE